MLKEAWLKEVSTVEAEDFSFAAEHIQDEPSIHVRSLASFQSIPSKNRQCEHNQLFEYNNQQPNNVIYETLDEEEDNQYSNFMQQNGSRAPYMDDTCGY